MPVPAQVDVNNPSRHPCPSALPSNDGAVLLDLEHDKLLKLNRVGVEIWKLLSLGDTETEIVSKIADKYGVDRQRVAGDVRALLRRISELGIAIETAMLTETSRSAGSPVDPPTFRWYAKDPDKPSLKPELTTVFAAFLGLIAFDFILCFRSFRSLCSCVEKFPVKRRGRLNTTMTGFVCGAVDRACVWYPKQALCLQRSAVTACLLRFHGIPARMTIGVRPMPFLAHAWVEVDGSVVNDFPNVKSFYPSLASY